MANIKEIAFIDPAVRNIDTLIEGRRSEVAAVRLGAAAPVMAQIARALDGRSGLDAIHIISHGVAGEWSFAAGPLSLDTVDEHRANLGAIGQTLDDGGDLLLWSCEMARAGAARPLSKRWRAPPAPRSRRRAASSARQRVEGAGDSTSALRFFGPVRRLMQSALRLTVV